MFPHPEEVLLLLPLLVVLRGLRALAWRLKDYDLRLVALEVLAGVEITAMGSVFSASSAVAWGEAGVVIYVVCWFFIRLYRRQFWVWNEKGNTASVLASVKAQELWIELGLVLVWANFTGGWIGYRYILWFSWHRTETFHCDLPMKFPLLTSGAVEALGTFAIELSTRGLHSTYECTQALHFWMAFSTRLVVDAVAKISAVRYTGGMFNPMAASVRYHMCYMDIDYAFRLLFVYIFCPCFGAILAVMVAPYLRHVVHDLHDIFSFGNRPLFRQTRSSVRMTHASF